MIGIVLAVIGAFFVSMATNVLGTVLQVGYALDARHLGTATVILALVTLAGDCFSGRAWCLAPTTGSRTA